MNPMTPFPSLRSWKIPAALTALLVAGLANAQSPSKLDPPVKPTVTGKFTGNGKNAAIKFITVEEHEPFSDKEAITETTNYTPDFALVSGARYQLLVWASDSGGQIAVGSIYFQVQ